VYRTAVLYNLSFSLKMEPKPTFRMLNTLKPSINVSLRSRHLNIQGRTVLNGGNLKFRLLTWDD
jgi:hypothetical protein